MTDSLFIWLPLAAFFGAWISAVTGMGGGLLILALCTFLLPVHAALPVSGVLVMIGQIVRTWQFHHQTRWDIARPFVPGSVIGAVLGAYVFFSLTENFIRIMLGCLMLWLCWVPPGNRQRRLADRIPFPWFWVGIVHTFFSTVSGVGGLFQSLMVNSGMSKQQIVATIAGTLVFMSLFKTLGYILAGFDFAPYLLIIVLSWIGGWTGTHLGKHSLEKVSDKVFRLLIRSMITLFAARLFISAGINLAGL